MSGRRFSRKKGLAIESYIKRRFEDWLSRNALCIRTGTAGGLAASSTKPIDLLVLVRNLGKPLFIQIAKHYHSIDYYEKIELVKISRTFNGIPLLIYKKEGRYVCKKVFGKKEYNLTDFLIKLKEIAES